MKMRERIPKIQNGKITPGLLFLESDVTMQKSFQMEKGFLIYVVAQDGHQMN